MNQVFRPFLIRCVLVSFDDILVYSADVTKHEKHLGMVFVVLRDNQLFTNWKKKYDVLASTCTKNRSLRTYRVDNLFISPIYSGIESLIKQFLRTLHEKENVDWSGIKKWPFLIDRQQTKLHSTYNSSMFIISVKLGKLIKDPFKSDILLLKKLHARTKKSAQLE